MIVYSKQPIMELYAHDIDRLKEITALIEQELDKHLTLKSLSRQYGISVATLKRHFKIHFNKSVHRYILEQRMVKSVQLLISDRLTISDVANKVGYSDANSFAKAFKLQYGISPKELRHGIIISK